MDCSLPGSSVHGISQARILERVPFPTPGIFPIQESNLDLQCLLHCRWVHYHLSHLELKLLLLLFFNSCKPGFCLWDSGPWGLWFFNLQGLFCPRPFPGPFPEWLCSYFPVSRRMDCRGPREIIVQVRSCDSSLREREYLAWVSITQ